MHIKHLPTAEITIHPKAAHLPQPNPDSPTFRALVAMMTDTGVAPRVVAVSGFRALDGFDVLAAAREIGFTTLACREIQADFVPTAIIEDLIGREHWTKSQIAYLAYPVFSEIMDASKRRRVANLKKGLEAPKSAQTLENPRLCTSPLLEAKTGEQLADALGISRKFLYYAAQLHKAFEADEELRTKFEPLILEQDENGHSAGLGAIIAGIAGFEATKGRPVVPAPQLTLWQERVEKMLSPARFQGWEKLPEELRQKVALRFRDEFLKVVPDEIRDAVLAAAKTRRAA